MCLTDQTVKNMRAGPRVGPQPIHGPPFAFRGGSTEKRRIKPQVTAVGSGSVQVESRWRKKGDHFDRVCAQCCINTGAESFSRTGVRVACTVRGDLCVCVCHLATAVSSSTPPSEKQSAMAAEHIR